MFKNQNENYKTDMILWNQKNKIKNDFNPEITNQREFEKFMVEKS